MHVFSVLKQFWESEVYIWGFQPEDRKVLAIGRLMLLISFIIVPTIITGWIYFR